MTYLTEQQHSGYASYDAIVHFRLDGLTIDEVIAKMVELHTKYGGDVKFVHDYREGHTGAPRYELHK